MSAAIHAPIDLAHEAAFRVGGLEVRPATLEVLAAGRREVLEPRVMQVLVALAGRRGEVVSRDDLLQSCWGGRIVGEDAINRCISRLRRLGRANTAFDVEAVPRVGYRLAERGGPSGRRRPWRLWAGIAVAAVALALGIAGAWVWRHSLAITPSGSLPRVQVAAFTGLGDDPAARRFAMGLAGHVVGVMNEASVPAVAVPAGATGDGPRPELTLRGTVERAGDVLRVHLFLHDARSDIIVWTKQFERPQSKGELLSDAAAGAATNAIYAVAESRGVSCRTIDPDTQALLLHAQELLTTPNEMEPRAATRAFEQAVARAPGCASARAGLSISLLQDGERQRARSEAERAIRASPAEAGAAYDTLVRLAASKGRLQAEAARDEGLKGAPDFPYLVLGKCHQLFIDGRATESLAYCRRALALRPLAGWILQANAFSLAAAGEPELAARTWDRAARYNPDHIAIRYYRFEQEAFDGDPDKALALLHDPATAPGLQPRGLAALELVLKARKTGAAQDIDEALASVHRAFDDRPYDREFLVLAPTALGRIDAAFEALNSPMFEQQDSMILMASYAAPLRRDPRWWPLAAKAGLVGHWIAQNKWPDFCRDRRYPLDCRDEAVRAVRPAPAAE